MLSGYTHCTERFTKIWTWTQHPTGKKNVSFHGSNVNHYHKLITRNLERSSALSLSFQQNVLSYDLGENDLGENEDSSNVCFAISYRLILCI